MVKVPTNDYTQGQMMGMLCIVRLIRNAEETNIGIPGDVFDKIERIATESLAEYLGKPEEDVTLMVDTQLNDI
jgi:hypothetical protein